MLLILRIVVLRLQVTYLLGWFLWANVTKKRCICVGSWVEIFGGAIIKRLQILAVFDPGWQEKTPLTDHRKDSVFAAIDDC